MGLLDEAIREHLELKRRRGADPTEVEQLEREALGPVRRVAQEQPDVEPEGAEPLGVEEHDLSPDEFPNGAGLGYDEDYASGPEYEYAPEHEGEFPPQHQDRYAVQEPRMPEDQDFREPEPPPADAPGPHDAALPPQPVPAGAPGTPIYEDPGVETAEYDVEAAHAEEAEEDVLEETPEFLQDTPDHDRLWFEQRPPKDFDFEG